MKRLEGRVGIITGAAQGIGRELALGAAAEGATVVVADLSDPAPVVAEIEALGGSALGVTTDVASPDSTEAMASAALQQFGRVDFLVNNAALFSALQAKSWLEIDVAEWDKVMAVNLRGLFLASKAVAPSMLAQGAGKIVNISSNTALVGVAGLLHYVTSKGGVIGFTRALARELGPAGINVNTVTPGVTMSEGMVSMMKRSGREAVDTYIPMKSIRREQLPRDLVGAVLFLVSSDSDFITGQVINVDGGYVSH